MWPRSDILGGTTTQMLDAFLAGGHEERRSGRPAEQGRRPPGYHLNRRNDTMEAVIIYPTTCPIVASAKASAEPLNVAQACVRRLYWMARD